VFVWYGAEITCPSTVLETTRCPISTPVSLSESEVGYIGVTEFVLESISPQYSSNFGLLDLSSPRPFPRPLERLFRERSVLFGILW
jgi:hypothetical protein